MKYFLIKSSSGPSRCSLWFVRSCQYLFRDKNILPSIIFPCIRWFWLLILETKPKWVTMQMQKPLSKRNAVIFTKFGILLLMIVVSCQFELGSTRGSCCFVFIFELEIAWWQWIWGSSLSCGLILWYELCKTLIDFWWFSVISIGWHPSVTWEIWQMKF